MKYLAVSLVFVALASPLPASAELAALTTRDRVLAVETDVAILKTRVHRLRMRMRALEEELAFERCEVARLWEAIGRSSAELTATYCDGEPTPDTSP
jgi:hypothetical protein